MISQFRKDALVYMLPGILSRGIGFFLLPLYTRILSPADYGALDMFMMVGNIANLTVSLEINQGLAIYHAESKDDHTRRSYASTAFRFTIFCYLLFFGVAFCAATPLSHFIIGKEGSSFTFQLTAFYILFNGLFLFLQNQLRWELRSLDYATSNIMMSILTAIGAFGFAYMGGLGLNGVLYGMILGVVMASFYSFYLLRGTLKGVWDKSKLRKMLVYSVPFVPSSVCVFLSLYIDRILINSYLGLNDVGIYGIGIRVAAVASLLISGFNNALTPLILKHHSEPETPTYILKIFNIYFSLTLILFLGSSLFMPELLRIMASPAFYGAKTITPLLILATLFANMYIFTPGIFLAKKTHIVVWINLTGLIINIGFNIVLIPFLGILGSALATMLSSILTFLIYLFFNQNTYRLSFDFKVLIIASVSTLLFSIPGYCIEEVTIFNFFAKLGIFAVATLILLRIGPLSISDIKKFISSEDKIMITQVDDGGQ